MRTTQRARVPRGAGLAVVAAAGARHSAPRRTPHRAQTQAGTGKDSILISCFLCEWSIDRLWVRFPL